MKQRILEGWWLIAAISMLALVFAGCGGGGGGTAAVPDDMMPTQPTTPTVDQEQVDQLRADLEAAKMAMEGVAETDLAGMVAAIMTIVDLKQQIYDLTMADEDKAALEEGQAMLAAAQMKLDEYNAEQMRMAEEAAEAARMAKVKGIAKAILAKNRPGSSVLDNLDVNAGGVIVLDGDTLGKDDKFGEEEFTKSSAVTVPIAGWKGSTYTRTVENEMDNVVVYHNAERDKSQSYMSYFQASGETRRTDNPPPLLAGDLTDTGDNNRYDSGGTNEGVLSLGTDVPDEDTAKLLDPRIFRPSERGETSRTYTGDAGDNKANEFAGTFAGLAGHYICGNAGGTCAVNFNAQTGRVTSIASDWTFRPTAATARGRVRNVIKDVDYLSFGYWMQTITAEDGSTSYGINTFAKGSQPFTWTGLDDADGAAAAALQGTATYNGDATGYYARQNVEPDGKVGETNAAGQFLADVSLTASFGGNKVAANDFYSLTGTVNNFTDTEGNMISDRWSLMLDRKSFDNTTNTVTGGSTTGGGKAGVWSAAFYGNPIGATVPDDNAASDPRAPLGVAGEFTGNFSNGNVIGAFGATR